MAPHLTALELDTIAAKSRAGWPAAQIHGLICESREQAGIEPPMIWAVRRAVRGTTHKRSRVETRGRKRSLTPTQGVRVRSARLNLVQKANGEHEVTYGMIKKAAHVDVGRNVIARELASSKVKWRWLREAPPRTLVHEATKKEVCDEWREKPARCWHDGVDMIIGNKKFPISTADAARKRLCQQQVRGVFRTRGEGLHPGFAKPNLRKHRFNPGGCVSMLAGICGDKIVVWEEVHGRWTGAKVVAMYEGPILDALRRWRPYKRRWLIQEDNDPTGYKSRLGSQAKATNGMCTLGQPPYSPDLNPLDFSIWKAIQDRALQGKVPGTVSKFKSKLRRVALRLPAPVVSRAVADMCRPAENIVQAHGRTIPKD